MWALSLQNKYSQKAKMFPNKKQWQSWSLPSKLTAIGTYVGIIGVVLSTLFFIITSNLGSKIIITIPPLPGDSGWLLLGDFDPKQNHYTRGPLYKIIHSNYADKSLLPRKGEHIETTAKRNLIIADYENSGTTKLFQPPWQEGILDDDDYTGVKILKSSRLEVRDVSLGHYPGMPYVVWVRIGHIP